MTAPIGLYFVINLFQTSKHEAGSAGCKAKQPDKGCDDFMFLPAGEPDNKTLVILCMLTTVYCRWSVAMCHLWPCHESMIN